MGVTYVAVPVEGETLRWLEKLGVGIPGDLPNTRLPTFRELRGALDSPTGFDIEIQFGDEGVVVALIEPAAEATKGQYTRINIFDFRGDDESCTPVFEKGSELLIIDILSRLANTTGPVALVPDTGERPLIVASGADSHATLREWVRVRMVDDA